MLEKSEGKRKERKKERRGRQKIGGGGRPAVAAGGPVSSSWPSLFRNSVANFTINQAKTTMEAMGRIPALRQSPWPSSDHCRLLSGLPLPLSLSFFIFLSGSLSLAFISLSVQAWYGLVWGHTDPYHRLANLERRYVDINSFVLPCAGNLLSPIVAHIFCNVMGLPTLSSSRTKGAATVAFVAGLAGFCWLLLPASSPDLYNNRRDGCSCWHGYCSWN